MRRLKSCTKLLIFVAWIAFASSLALAQTDKTAPMAADAHPSFEVATIKLSDPDAHNQNTQWNARHIRMQNATVKGLIWFAYAVHYKQIANDPPWLDTEHYDIDGIPDKEGTASLPQYQEMIQKLLADRFGLKFHREKHELPVYAITLAKGGSKLTKSTHDPNSFPSDYGDRHGNWQGRIFENVTIADFALDMQSFLDRPIVDQTGLTGKFDFSLHWTPDNVEATDPNAPPGLFTAIQEQLGLKLEPVKAPADVIVIDHVDRPSAN